MPEGVQLIGCEAAGRGIDTFETAATINTGRTGIFALMGAFHGMTLGSLACTTDADSRAGAGIDLTGVTHLPAPYMFPELDTLKYYETLLTDDHSGVAKPAAFIIEAVQVDGGVSATNAQQLIECGADILVAGSAVFKAEDPAAVIQQMKA